MERAAGVEPASTAWKAVVLPLDYARRRPGDRRRVALRVKMGRRVWSWWRELNPRHGDYKSPALPAELRQRVRPVRRYQQRAELLVFPSRHL